MTVRRVRRGEGESIRNLRLRALSDAPYAFGALWEREKSFSPEHWEALAERSELADNAVVFVAVNGIAWVGMASVYLVEEDQLVADVRGLWVDEAHRRRGLARELMRAVEDWARRRGAALLHLSVTDRATAAAELYRRLGFKATGERRPVATDPSLTEILLERFLRPG